MARRLGLPSGIGLVVANMIGAGVFLSTGFMAQELGPGAILLAWVAGAVLALAGAVAYAEVARIVPRSGGEYRYLSELLHPAFGYLAGWTSLLVGFSAPIAVSALAAGSYLAILVPSVKPLAAAVVLVVVLTAAHAGADALSKATQNALVAVKAALIATFAGLGLFHSRYTWPDWQPPRPPESALAAFMASLFYVAFAFSGWNAAVYVAEEFERPARDVPRSMLAGCALVALLYLAVNWVFVANLTPDRAAVVFTYESRRITLGHLIMADLLGEAGARAMSALAVAAFVSSVSAMTFAGPRVYAAMAGDGYLPRFLAGAEGRPSPAAVAMQGVLAVALLFTHTVQQVLQNVGALLTLFAALTALSLFRVRLRGDRRPSSTALAAAAVYGLSSAWMLYFGFSRFPRLLPWLAAIAAAAVAFYGWTARPRPGAKP
ncbi:MAG TPA: APC family permease [Vicinamibacteria bacterium]|jgi:APA family basic amino acid/polyamine antiporter